MRTVATFVLRVLADSDDPAALRGVVRPVLTGEERPFTDGEELLAALHDLMAGRSAGPGGAQSNVKPRDPQTL